VNGDPADDETSSANRGHVAKGSMEKASVESSWAEKGKVALDKKGRPRVKKGKRAVQSREAMHKEAHPGRSRRHSRTAVFFFQSLKSCSETRCGGDTVRGQSRQKKELVRREPKAREQTERSF